MKNVDVSKALNSVMMDLNIKYDSEEILDEGLLDFLKSAGRGVANTGRNVSLDVSHAVGDKLETDASIARHGLILVSQDGKTLFGVRGVVPGGPETNDILKQYQAKGFTELPPEDPKRAILANERFNVIGPEQIEGNLKAQLTEIAKELVQAAQAFGKMVGSKQLITASTVVSDGSISKIMDLIKKTNNLAKAVQSSSAPTAAASPAPETTEPPLPIAPSTPTPEGPLPISSETPAGSAPVSTETPAPARVPLDFSKQPMAPDTQGLSAGAEQLQSPEVRQRIAAAANQDEEENPGQRFAESRNSRLTLGPLDIF